jgi:hypothetical protein
VSGERPAGGGHGRGRPAGAAASGGRLPGPLVGDHGRVCGAGRLGIEAMGLADSHDPAVLFAEAEGRATAVVPLDDAARCVYYRQLSRYVLNRVCLSQ